MNAKPKFSRAKAPRFEKYGYSETDFAVSGEITNFNAVRVHCSSDSFNHQIEFEGLGEMNQSDWTVLYETGARLSDGTILYEGYCPDVPRSEQTLF